MRNRDETSVCKEILFSELPIWFCNYTSIDIDHMAMFVKYIMKRVNMKHTG